MSRKSAKMRDEGLRGGSQALVLAVILTAQLMVVLDATIVNVALPHIQKALGFTSSSLSWVLNAYVLTFGGLLLLGARSGDILGRKRVFLAGLTLFSLSSLAGGLAVSSWMLLAARAVQGVGGAMAAPAALALLTSAFPEGAERIRAIGLFTTVSAAGAAAGLFAGGVITQVASWRWVMYVNVPIGIAVVLVGSYILVETERRHGRFDIAGALTSTIGMTSVVFGLVEAGTSGWRSPITAVSLVGGLILLTAFVRIEMTASEPILPIRVVADRTRSSANLARGFGYAGMYGMTFFLTQFFQDVQGHSALRTGIEFLPTPLCVFAASQLVSKVLSSKVAPKALMVTGSMMSLSGLAILTHLSVTTSYIELLPALLLIGAGLGTSFVSLTSASLSGISPSDAGAASGLINVMQQLGAALGLAVLVTVFDSATSAARRASGARDVIGRGVMVHGMDIAFVVAALFSLAALAMVVFGVPAASLVKEHPSEEVALSEAA